MAQIARVTTWASGQVLTAATLNAEFSNIITAWNNIDSAAASWTKLSISGDTTVSGTLTNSVVSNTDSQKQLLMTNSGTGYASLTAVNSTSTNSLKVGTTGSGSTSTWFSGLNTATSNYILAQGGPLVYLTTDSNSLYFGTNNTKALQIDTSQNVIIPNAKLQIGGNQAFPIVQIVTGTSTTSKTSTSSTYADTNLTAAITPKFNTSKILIFASGSFSGGPGGVAALVTLARGGTNLLATNGGQQNTLNGFAGCPLLYYDSPASTSSLTYSVQIKNSDNLTTVAFGGTSTQFIVLAEIAQ